MSTPDAPPDRNPIRRKAPYGYRWRESVLEPNPVEASVRKMIYELLVKLRRKKAVARALNDAGYRTRDGSKWSDTTIDRLVRDPTAKGLYQTSRAPTKSGSPESDSQRGVLCTQVEAIISPELWAECNALLDSNGLGKRRGRQPTNLFAGVTVCQCGRRMYVPSNSHDYRCTACGNRIAAEDLEAIFAEQVRAYDVAQAGGDPIQGIGDQWPALDREEKRRVVESITEQIMVARDEIDITFCHLVDPQPTTPKTVPPSQPDEQIPATPKKKQPGPVTSPAAGSDVHKIDAVTLAVAMMKEHPDWSARKLAQAAGCSHTTLTRSPFFRSAKALANSKRYRPAGWKTADGAVEAVAECEAE
jgi:Recombinase